MNKREAAEIIANHAQVVARKYGWTDRMDAMRIGIVLSEMQFETTPGCRLHAAALARPADSTIRQAGRRNYPQFWA